MKFGQVTGKSSCHLPAVGQGSANCFANLILNKLSLVTHFKQGTEGQIALLMAQANKRCGRVDLEMI